MPSVTSKPVESRSKVSELSIPLERNGENPPAAVPCVPSPLSDYPHKASLTIYERERKRKGGSVGGLGRLRDAFTFNWREIKSPKWKSIL